ncbi:unnamed protein product [Sphenostylis stenocarpa]|uniref:Uncharacterized protein n=1 Tax=Sphenostylis stenocarpa TaxID=92480 RepID=A0AA86VB13_9FABA|nr:unnamed protein product [Sphenostylis stenocarpa]
MEKDQTGLIDKRKKEILQCRIPSPLSKLNHPLPSLPICFRRKSLGVENEIRDTIIDLFGQRKMTSV